MQLIGRDRELAAVARAVVDVRNGSSRVLGVLGEAGIGKSALLAALAAAAREAGLAVSEGRALEHERDVPFGVAADALGHELATGLTAGRGGAGERVHCHRMLHARLETAARERPRALLLDDLHWADDASLELVVHLLRRPPDAPLLLAFATRLGERAHRVLDAARTAPGFQELALDPLDRGASLALLAGLADAGLRERIAGAAAGNPLFLRELARAAHDPEEAGLPPTLVAAVQHNVAGLPAPARALVAGAAVAGDRFDPELAAAAAGYDSEVALEALDQLVAGDLVRPDGGRRAFAFRHPLVRRAVYDGSPPAWRLGAHERVAAALAARGAAATLRAHHVERFARPGDEDAIALLAQAAASSLPAVAARYYSAALRLLPDGDGERRAALLAPMADALAAAGRLADARAALVEALDLLGSEPDLALVAACARLETEIGHHSDARRRLTAAFADAPPGRRAEFALGLAVGAFYEGRLAELRRWSGQAIDAAEREGEPLLVAGAEALGALGALFSGDRRRVDRGLDRATAGLDALDDDAVAARPVAAAYVGLANLFSERFAAASASATRALAGEAIVSPLMTRALARVNLLELDAALRDAETVEQIAWLQGEPRALHCTLWALALVRFQRGDAAGAERAADECAALSGTIAPTHLTRAGDCTVAAILATRQPERGLRAMVAAAGPNLELADPTSASWLRLRYVRAAIATGAFTDAERFARAATEHSARLGLPAGAVRAACARAELLLARGEPAAAFSLALEATAAAERITAPLDAAEARLLSGRALAAAGERAAAKAALQHVAADAARGGALRLRDEAARELRRLGTRVSGESRRAARGAGLSERERDIAALAVEGRSNREIAAALFLSEKTVANALTRVYAKLGIRSRAQLVAT